jgi:hypothetical protein
MFSSLSLWTIIHFTIQNIRKCAKSMRKFEQKKITVLIALPHMNIL